MNDLQPVFQYITMLAVVLLTLTIMVAGHFVEVAIMDIHQDAQLMCQHLAAHASQCK